MRQLLALILGLGLCLPWLAVQARAMLPPECETTAAETAASETSIPETTVPETVSTESTVPETTGDVETVVLAGFADNQADPDWPYIYQLILLEENDSVEDALSGADYQYRFYSDTGGSSHKVMLQWTLDDESLAQPGLHILRASPVLQENMVLAEGFDGVVFWPMYRKGGAEPVEVIPMHPPTTTDALIAQGSADPLSELAIVTRNKRCALGENGWWNTTKEIVWSWDASGLDTNRTGKQILTGSITGMPGWLTIPEEHRGGEVAVFILPTDRIELYAPTNLSRNGVLKFEWIYSTAAVSEVCLQRQDESGAWADCDAGWYRYRDASLFTNGHFQLWLPDIPAGQYTFRLAYLDAASGEAVRRYTEPLSITIPENLMELICEDGSVPEELDIGGDRDGGDSEGADLPDYSQPAPESPTEPAPTQSPEQTPEPTTRPAPTTAPEPTAAPTAPTVWEAVTESASHISGMRLKVLTAAGDTVLFEKEGISLEIPSSLLAALDLGDYDLLEVVILRPRYDTVQISVLKNGTPVADLTGTEVYVPWNREMEIPTQCLDERGTLVSEIVYITSGELLRFTISSSGTFLLALPRPEPTASAEETEVPVQTQTAMDMETSGADTEIPLYILILFPVLILLLILAIAALWRLLWYE